ncbi:MAG: NAD kinase [Bacteroidetes bacterium]|nr:MAG: NAD kinase [Bacteroidota bacterium]
MKIALHGRNFKPEAQPYIAQMLKQLQQRGAELSISKTFAEFLHPLELFPDDCHLYHTHEDLGNPDFFLSFGGDGTLLEAVTHVGERQTPIVGINTGRLGFLANTSPNELNAMIDCLYKGYYTFDDRLLISVISDEDIFEGINFGLNEFAITKRDTSSMIVVHTYLNGEYLNSYWADGLIVSTPTGSTGYALSCGGPVVMPQSNLFIVAPVSPHNLNVRPLIVADDSVISFSIEGRSKNFLVSLDSRSKVIDSSVQIAVRRERFKARLVKLQEHNFLNTLRHKLSWGLDTRN